MHRFFRLLVCILLLTPGFCQEKSMTGGWSKLTSGELGFSVAGTLGATQCLMHWQYNSSSHLGSLHRQLLPLATSVWLPQPAESGNFHMKLDPDLCQGVVIDSLKQLDRPPVLPFSAFERGLRLHPALIDRPEGVFLLGLGLTILIIWLIYSYSTRLSLQLISVLLLLATLRLCYLATGTMNPLRSIEQNALSKAIDQLNSAFQDLSSAEQTAEQYFLDDINLFKDRIRSWYLSRRPDQTILEQEFTNLLKSIRPHEEFEAWLSKEVRRKEGVWIYQTHPERKMTQVQIDYMHNFYPLLMSMMGKEAVGTNEEEFRHHMSMISSVRELVQKYVERALNIDAILNNPDCYFEVFALDFDLRRIFGQGRSKRNYWSTLSGLGDWDFMILGQVHEEYINRNLAQAMILHRNSLRERNSNDSLEVFLSSISPYRTSLEPFGWPEVSRAAAKRQAGVSSSRAFSFSQDGKFYLAVQDLCPFSRDLILTVMMDASPILEEIRTTKDLLYGSFVLLVAGIILISSLFSHRITRPMQALKIGLSRVALGDLSHEIIILGKNQFSQAAARFNHMIYALREKEFMSRFVSRMARQALGHDTQHTSREKVMVLYCSFKNLDELLKNMQINDAFSTLQRIIVHHGGLVDKFTGQALLALFRSPQDGNEAFMAALDIMDYANEEGSSRKFSVGLAYGEVILGHIGANQRKDFTCIGNTVNMAARLGSRSPEGQKCILFADDAALSRLGNADTLGIKIQKHHGVPIKGKKETQTLNQFSRS